MDLIEARERALAVASVLEPEKIELGMALGRVLAKDVKAARDIPAEGRSRWDGFAFHSRDVENASPQQPVSLKIVQEEISAGHSINDSQVDSACFRIMTGAALPQGMDTVIPVEDAFLDSNSLILTAPVRPETGIIAPGSDAPRGKTLLEKSDILTPTRLALAAATGLNTIEVFRRPRVAILATGDELRETGSKSERATTFCNNTHLLAGLVLAGGGYPVQTGIAPDDPETIFSLIKNALADIVITTGGMGAGTKDFMTRVWQRLGVCIHFDRLNISPGKGSALGTINDRFFMALPGNPRAARIVFAEICLPLMTRLQGTGKATAMTVNASAMRSIKKKKGAYQAFEGILESRKGQFNFYPAESIEAQGISILRNGLGYTLLGPEQTHVAAGEQIEVRIPDFPLMAGAIFIT